MHIRQPLSPGLRRWLAFDAQWLGWFDPSSPRLERRSFRDMLNAELGPEMAEVCDFGPILDGDCYPLPGGSDSRAFLFVGKPDGAGEHPVLLVDVDDVPMVCVEAPGIDVYLASCFGAIRVADDNYAAAFDDEVYGDAMVAQARLNLHGFKSPDLGASDTEHVDGPEAAEEAFEALFGDMGGFD